MSTEPQPASQTSAPAPQPRPAESRPAEPRPAGDPGLGAPRPPGPPLAEPLPHHKIRHTRISGLWFAVAFFAVVLLFLLIFILQNGREASISYLGMHGHLPLGVALLLAAVCGVLLTMLAGAARIGQLRTVARRHRRSDARRAAASSAPADPGR